MLIRGYGFSYLDSNTLEFSTIYVGEVGYSKTKFIAT